MVCCDMPRLSPHGGQVFLHYKKMTIIRNEDPNELLGFELDPWPPLSDEEIEERERQAEWEDFLASIPTAAERNPNLK